MSRAPSLFVSHGSPMFALEPGLLGPNLQRIGEDLSVLTAIVVVSPHWQALAPPSEFGALAIGSGSRVARNQRDASRSKHA